eukprot:7378269-Prymnesium_polylepis.2
MAQPRGRFHVAVGRSGQRPVRERSSKRQTTPKTQRKATRPRNSDLKTKLVSSVRCSMVIAAYRSGLTSPHAPLTDIRAGGHGAGSQALGVATK